MAILNLHVALEGAEILFQGQRWSVGAPKHRCKMIFLPSKRGTDGRTDGPYYKSASHEGEIYIRLHRVPIAGESAEISLAFISLSLDCYQIESSSKLVTLDSLIT